jgi:hypothetical protein
VRINITSPPDAHYPPRPGMPVEVAATPAKA